MIYPGNEISIFGKCIITCTELSLELTQQLDEHDELHENRAALIKRIFALCPSSLTKAVTPSQQKKKSGYAYTVESNL